MSKDKQLEVIIKDGVLSITIGTDILVHALKYGMEGRLEDGLEIEDEDEFLAEFVNELRNEQEDGATPVHRMLDEACYNAVCNGAQGLKG